MNHISARQALRAQHLTVNLIYKVMRLLFPKKNDSSSCSYEELVGELDAQGIQTLGQFMALMKKHRRALIEIDTARISPKEAELLSQICTAAEMADSLRRRYWFTYPGLVRQAITLEFGETYEISETET